MNQTAIKAALNPLNAQARLYAAMRRTAILKQSVVHLCNRKGDAILAIRWSSLRGFIITDKLGHDVTKSVFNVIRGF